MKVQLSTRGSETEGYVNDGESRDIDTAAHRDHSDAHGRAFKEPAIRAQFALACSARVGRHKVGASCSRCDRQEVADRSAQKCSEPRFSAQSLVG